jgi:Tol biopolymer transport system component
VSRLKPGPHTISLPALPANCSLPGGPQTVTVAIARITPVNLEISCSPIPRLEKIAYTFDSTVAGGSIQRTVGLINPDGSGASTLAVGDAPSWSPDGRRLVLTEASCSGYYSGFYYGYSCAGGLVIVDPEMGNRTAIGGRSAAFSPAWSPTGDLIAFTRCCESADRNRIYFLQPDGTSSGQLIITQVITAGDPGWSPDGKRIAFTCSSGNANDLCVIDRDGGNFVRLTTNIRVAVGRPAWKPDGTRIAFSVDAREGAAISLLDPATGAVTRVTEGSHPAWSRDGSLIVFSGVRFPGLYTVNVDGPYVAPLRNGAYGAPAWRP